MGCHSSETVAGCSLTTTRIAGTSAYALLVTAIEFIVVAAVVSIAAIVVAAIAIAVHCRSGHCHSGHCYCPGIHNGHCYNHVRVTVVATVPPASIIVDRGAHSGHAPIFHCADTAPVP